MNRPIAAFVSDETNMFNASLSIVSFDEKKWAWFVTSQEYVLRRVEQLVSLKCCSNACTFQTLRFIALEVIILVTATRIKPTVNFIISLIVRFIQTLI